MRMHVGCIGRRRCTTAHTRRGRSPLARRTNRRHSPPTRQEGAATRRDEQEVCIAGRRCAARALFSPWAEGKEEATRGFDGEVMEEASLPPSFSFLFFFLFSFSEVLWTRLRRVIFLTKNPATSMVPKPRRAPGWCSLRFKNQYILISYVQG